jgi:acetyl esterase/lipase
MKIVTGARMKWWVALIALLGIPAVAMQMRTAGNPVTVAYAKDGTPDQTMDVTWPSGRAAATVLFIHGGSLQESGQRRSAPMYRDVCVQIVAAGHACASMDYRLAPTHRWPAMPNDVALAMVALRKLLADGKGDPSRIFLFGHSSGCHLAAIVATNPVYLASAGLKTTDVAGIIPMGCLLDHDDATVRGLTADRIRTRFMAEPQDVATYVTPENYLAANPASFIGPHVPPALVVVADRERFMPPVVEQGARFVRLLLESNVAANMVLVPGDHVSSIEGVARAGDPSLTAILSFIRDPKGDAAKH